MNTREHQARREGFEASSKSECRYSGKLRAAWMYGFREGQDFLKRVEEMACPICGEIYHAPGCPNDLEGE
jgi:hypothetical protein